MFKNLSIVIVFLVFISSAWCDFDIPENAGTTAFPFLLKLQYDARATALAGMIANWYKSPGYTICNPSTPSIAGASGIAVVYGNYWGLFNTGGLAYTRTFGETKDHYVTFVLLGVSYGEFIKTNIDAQEIGTFTPGDFEFVTGYSRRVGKYSSIGVNVKFIYSFADTFSASAFALDVGFSKRLRRKRTQFAVVVENLGFMLSTYGDEKAELPLCLKVGGWTDLPEFPGALNAQLELSKDNGFRFGSLALSPKIGLDIEPVKNIEILIAYTMKPTKGNSSSLLGLSGGIVVDLKNVSFEYGIQHTGQLGLVNRFTLNYRGI